MNRALSKERWHMPDFKEVGKSLLYFGFCFPLFYQLSGQFFHTASCGFDPKGGILQTPLPIALPICFIGIVLTYRFENRHFGMGLVFTVFMALLFSIAVLSEGGNKAGLDKFLLLIQFIVPLFGFILGKLYRPPSSSFLSIEAIALYVLLFIIPLQLVRTFSQETCLLVSDMHVFSLYQHIQYLPLIFLSLYFLAVGSLYKSYFFQAVCLMLAPLMGVFAVSSLQVSSLVFLLAGSVFFLFLLKTDWRYKFLLLLLVWIGVLVMLPNRMENYAGKFNSIAVEKTQNTGGGNKVADASPAAVTSAAVPRLIAERLGYWRYYIEGITSGPRAFFLGHLSPPDREAFPSAYNYYLDLVYNFGALALIPFIYLISLTLYKTARLAITRQFPRQLIFPAFIIFYYLFVENIFKVPFRQPYPGLIIFFLWGIYMERIEGVSSHSHFEKETDL